ncbi:pentapeptide repeat-containing protein [Microcoleus sp. B4-D4]|uniref:pentapeptide repeat-containing protein n=1 Tax=Microcoleus sp. B4-D4 TaxID=2818667 RepID=UPI002FD29F93
MTQGGNCFKEANLTDANFTGATLKFCDFREANLTRTRFYKVKALEYARLDNTYLANPQIRQLVITLNGQAQNFDGLNLEGVNLQGANLQGASFIGTNLNSANLRNADLSKAILKQAQLDGTDMTGAILTEACIEDWGITGSTNLEDVQCDYVFMRLETKDNPNRLRKPDNWGETFAEGEFADFIKPYVDTLDLYHSQDIDPRAISIALKNLSANHPEQELRFVAIERRGNNGLNLRFTTAPGADKSELSHEYFTDYARIHKELPLAVQLKLVAQDSAIRTLKDTIEQFIQTGTHQSKIHAETIQIVQGELIVTQNKGINIHSDGGSIGDISGLVGGDGVVNLGMISGNVTNTLNQLPNSLKTDEPNIKELLTQLQQAIENDSNLPDPDKADLLEQVQALAEAKQTEEPAKKEGLTRKARKMFEATLSSLPQTASIVEACSKLLPMILKALGLPA